MQKDVQCDGYVKRAVHVVKKDKLQIEVDVFNIHNQPTLLSKTTSHGKFICYENKR